ncbi:MAG: UbiX family flavin prenyltransferase [Bacteroidales bacterium]|nr:UbiX family flavin prenyltransferase [Bacteroidales bacterium]
MKKKIIIGITGASGAIYAQQLIEDVLRFSDFIVTLIYSENGKKVWNYELEAPLIVTNDRITVYSNDDMFAPPASGSSNYDAMIIIPCSMGTLSQISNGSSFNLIGRSADVMLKEKRKLILVPREAPYNLIHVQNMEKILLMGGIILPASPSFYNKPNNITDVVKSVTDRILKMLDVNIQIKEWGS